MIAIFINSNQNYIIIMLTKKEILLLTLALNDLAECQECTHKQAKKILEKIKARQENIFLKHIKKA